MGKAKQTVGTIVFAGGDDEKGEAKRSRTPIAAKPKGIIPEGGRFLGFSLAGMGGASNNASANADKYREGGPPLLKSRPKNGMEDAEVENTFELSFPRARPSRLLIESKLWERLKTKQNEK